MRLHTDLSAAAPTARTMRAVVQDEYGDTSVLRLEHVAVPEVGADDVLVEVGAAGVDRGVWHLMTGLPYPVRLAGYGVRRPKDRVRGREVAGRVVAFGSDVSVFRVGDEVFGMGEGTFAQLVAVPQAKLARSPGSVDVAGAAALPVSGTTALQAVRDHGRVRPGQQVLVLGASGGVGTLAAQIAMAYGAHVTGVCSAGKAELVRSLGVDDVLDHQADELPQGRFDVVIDTGGNRPLRQLRRTMTADGTLVIVGAETGGRLLGGVQRNLRAALLDPFVAQRLTSFIARENAADLTELARLVDERGVRPVVGRTYPLDQAAEAVRDLTAGRARGKLVVRP